MRRVSFSAPEWIRCVRNGNSGDTEAMHKIEICNDSFALMSQMADGSYDVIITDPPYAAEVQENMCSGSLAGVKSVPKYQLSFAPLTQRHWIVDAVRITQRWVISFCGVEEFGRYQDILGKKYVRGAIWAKPNSMGQLTADRPATSYEGVVCCHDLDIKKRWNGRGSYGIWFCNGTRGLRDRHPNEKPLELCLKLVSLFSERGETVFDPFCGSGAIGEACVRLGRNYVGLDSDPQWVDRASARLSTDLESVSDEYALGLCRAWGR
jgi:DNA modification methylase